MNKRVLILLLTVATGFSHATGQSLPLTVTNAQSTKNLAELLGYPHDSKLLIIHADDMGLSKSVNSACIKAFEEKGITSGSIMMPCHEASAILSYVKNHPGTDAGIHITLTAEWETYKWGGLTPSAQIPGLLDKNGNFFATVEELGKSARGAEAEKEIRAQIDKAIALGIKPTHLDTHMGSVLANPELIKVYIDLATEYKLPFLLPRVYLSMFPAEAAKALGSNIFLLDNLFMLDPQMIHGDWIEPYKKAVAEMKPGLNQMIVHLGFDNDEMRKICTGHEDYGSAWRQNDLNLVTSKEFKDFLKANNIVLIGWGQIRDVMNQASSK
jgi:chitin disaccharide deacetylase